MACPDRQIPRNRARPSCAILPAMVPPRSPDDHGGPCPHCGREVVVRLESVRVAHRTFGPVIAEST